MKKDKVILKGVSGMLLCTMIAYTSPVLAFTKNETVYSKSNSNGDNYRTIVTDQLENINKSNLLNDFSDLINIKNTSGDQTFSQDGQVIVWNSDGKNITYQGETKKELPVDCKITYTLDGKEMSAEEISGKSGNVKITLEYTNKESHKVKINGSTTTMYTPFVVVAGTVIDNEKNSDITISTGKVMDDGSKTMVAGIALPGLQESLNLDKDTIDIPSKIEISMTTQDFTSNSIMTYITPKVIEDGDLKVFDKLDTLFNKISILQSSSKELVEGTDILNNGVKKLETGVNDLTSANSETVVAIGKTAEKTAVLSEQQKSSIESQAANAATLSKDQTAAIEAQAANAATLSKEQTAAIEAQAASSATLSEQQLLGIRTAAESQAQLTEAQKTAIKAQATISDAKMTAIKEQAKLSVISSEYYNNLSEIEKGTIGSILIATAQKAAENAATAVANQASSDAVTLAQTTATKVAGDTAVATAQSTATQVAQSTASQVAQNTATTVAKQTASTVAQSTATTVAKQTASTVAQSTATTVAKQTAVSTAVQVGKTLSENIETLSEGTQELATGMKQFNDDGIAKICNTINGKGKDLENRVKKLSELANEYQSFTMDDYKKITNKNSNNSAETMDYIDGEKVKFVLVIDGVKKSEE